MQCERLIKMVKSWYLSVREETMAPARMVSFMEQHAATCEVCLQDQALKEEIAKITELVLPESKIPKAIRQQNSFDDDDGSSFEEDGFIDSTDDSEDTLVDDDEESDIIEDIDSEEDEFLEDGDED
jgi:hypothetical protein